MASAEGGRSRIAPSEDVRRGLAVCSRCDGPLDDWEAHVDHDPECSAVRNSTVWEAVGCLCPEVCRDCCTDCR